MIAHFVVCALGGQDLLEACIASIDTFGGEATTLDVIKLPDDTTDPAVHGRAFDQWRAAHRVMPPGDVIVLMDPDCALLSHGWRRELERAMALPEVGLWGAGSTKDYGPRVHASLCAIRGDLWNTSAATFLPIGAGPWRDTAGHYCQQAAQLSWRVLPYERGVDWVGGSAAWWAMERQRLWSAPRLLWSHLGGGSHSDPLRMTPWQRVKRWRRVQGRRIWREAVLKIILETKQ